MRAARTERATSGGPQAPERGPVARLLGRFHVTGVFWYRLHAWAAGNLPRWSVSTVVHVFTVFFFLTLFRIRRAVAANLVPVLGPAGPLETQRRIWRTFLAFAWCATERYEQLAAPQSPQVVVDGLSSWEEARGSGGGFIVLTAHVGSWEVAASVLSARLDRRVHLVREEELEPEAQRWTRERIARASDGRLVTHFAGDPRLALELLEALGRGEVAALQGDRPRTGGRTVTASVFGRTLELPAGPLALARLTGAALLPAFAFREGRFRYRIAFREPVHVPATVDRGRDLAAAAREVARAFEWAVARAPFQWFCFREVWRLEAQPEAARIESSPASNSPVPSETRMS
jgi:lauroyl/myristoyl acyltransferase